MQRDLHDGLGPMLAGMALAAGAARNLVRSNPAEADTLLAGLISDSRSATVDIRRLIYDLRPPRSTGWAWPRRSRRSFASAHRTTLGHRAPRRRPRRVPHVGNLPADVELAAYRIVLESFVNVRRHAQAEVHDPADHRRPLHVEVCDDGVGLPADARQGVGLRSMEVRAAEVGGVCTVTCPDEGGTRVHACSPSRLR